MMWYPLAALGVLMLGAAATPLPTATLLVGLHHTPESSAALEVRLSTYGGRDSWCTRVPAIMHLTHSRPPRALAPLVPRRPLPHPAPVWLWGIPPFVSPFQTALSCPTPNQPIARERRRRREHANRRHVQARPPGISMPRGLGVVYGYVGRAGALLVVVDTGDGFGL